MKISKNVVRIGKFFFHRKHEMLDAIFWKKLRHVAKARFNCWDRISENAFQENYNVLLNRPWSLRLELTNICNARCIFCVYKYQKRKKLVMSDRIFEKALNDYCALGGGIFSFSGAMGDSLCDKKFVKRVRMALGRQQIDKVITVTNGLNLNIQGIDAILESGISEITVSTGPWKKELYEQIYGVRKYALMRRNVTELLSRNQVLGEPVEIAIDFRSNLSMRKTLQLPDYREVSHYPHRVGFNSDFDSWRGRIKGTDLLPGMWLRPNIPLETEPCYWLYQPVILSNGMLCLCGCADFDGNSELVIDNILNKSLKDIWTSKKVQEVHNRFYRGDYPGICMECSFYLNLDEFRSKGAFKKAEILRNKMIKMEDKE